MRPWLDDRTQLADRDGFSSFDPLANGIDRDIIEDVEERRVITELVDTGGAVASSCLTLRNCSERQLAEFSMCSQRCFDEEQQATSALLSSVVQALKLENIQY
ncbi:unnamed protein product [Gongylonema pulchrum]|uniref:WAPL domain-containing protein n=1 Tax=Gongylonema pulchrum TaxID=637853 RepID=A0A183CXR8_9BILA|nr:unnamed protein product [Gongylonema pulchrum]